jgi:multiple sugar transport system permease protein
MRPRRSLLPFTPWHFLAAPIAALSVLPLVWMVLTSLQLPAEAQKFPPQIIPSTLHWQNYVDVWNQAPFGRWFVNTTIVSLAAVLGNVVFCSLAAYAFVRIRFIGGPLLFTAMLATLMVPFQVVMIPTFLIVRHLGMIDSLGALILPNLCTPLGIFLLRQFFVALPRDIEDAARIDGCTRLGVVWRVVFPLAKPALVTVAVITFLYTWNDFLWPLIVIQSPHAMTLQYGLNTFVSAHQTQWTLLMAGNVMSLLPMLILFFLGQRYFVQSVAASGIK